MDTTLMLVAAGALLAGLLIGWLLQHSRAKLLSERAAQLQAAHDKQVAATETINRQKSDAEMAATRLQALYDTTVINLQHMEQQLTESRQLINKTGEEKATLYAQLKHTREKLDNQQNDIIRLREQFKLEFNELAQKILDESNRKFGETSEQRVKQLLEPLKANIAEFKQKVEDTYDKESKERFTLGREVARLVEMSARVSQEANNLTSALKGSVKQQGNWGEMILESLLENSGLTKNREYFLQAFIRDAAGNVIRDEQGKGLQPDVTIYYPDQRTIIIDSKVSLVDWEQYVAATDVLVQKECLAAHIKSMRLHIDGLAKKNYPRYARALDYVLLFVPIEPAFLEALKTDTDLWKFAYQRKILLVSPTNLFAVLKIIADLWKVENQNLNAINIAEKAGALYDKFTLFVENMEGVGRKLDDATECYNNAFKQLSTGRGNLVNRAQELKNMGAAASKSLPAHLLDAAGLPD